VQAIGLLIIVYQFFARFDGYWDSAYVLLAVCVFSALVVIYFLSISIRLYWHLRLVNLIAPEQTPQFVIQRQPPPNYNTSQFTVQTITENSQYSMPPPAYNQIFPAQSQSDATQNENKY
jgi:hypothetical protein